MDNQEELLNLLGELGEFGPYQLKQTTLSFVPWLLSAVHMMSFVFVFPVLEHRCFIEDIDGANATNEMDMDSITMFIPNNTKGHLESCVKYEDLNQSSTIDCDNRYVYTSSYFHGSRITELDTVCDKMWMRAFLQTVFLLGTLVGAFTCGVFADRFGRKPVLCISGVLQCVFGLAVAYLDNFIALSVMMFWYGLFGGSGSVVPAVALTMEIVGASKRNICGTLCTVWFNIGALIVVAWAYFLPASILSMPKILQAIYALHSVLLFLHWCLLDESICWLWANGKRDEALVIAKKAAKSNGKILSERFSRPSTTVCSTTKEKCVHDHTPPSRSLPTLELFKHTKLRTRTLVMLFAWFSTNLMYFGLSFNSVNLLGNPYLMFVINVLVEIPGHLISIFVVPKMGYKISIAVSLLITGFLCNTLGVLGAGVTSTTLTMIAKVTATVAFNILNSYTSELFPTLVRNTAFGICVMAARSGAAIVPQINLLATTAEEIPNIAFGLAGLFASALVMLLLPQTIEDVECSGKEKRSGDDASEAERRRRERCCVEHL